MASEYAGTELDLAQMSLRQVNDYLHHQISADQGGGVDITNPAGQHSIAVGLDGEVRVDIHGHAGYYVAAMNKGAQVTVHGNVERGVAENMMSGLVRVKGNASQCAGASARGGLLVVEGDASSRCGISMKGCDIVVGGSVGHVSGFMGQLGHLVVCGDAAEGLGDSLYEAVIYVRGQIAGLGADARQEEIAEDDFRLIAGLLERAGLDCDAKQFKKVASARQLYHWNASLSDSYR